MKILELGPKFNSANNNTCKITYDFTVYAKTVLRALRTYLIYLSQVPSSLKFNYHPHLQRKKLRLGSHAQGLPAGRLVEQRIKARRNVTLGATLLAHVPSWMTGPSCFESHQLSDSRLVWE